MCVRNYKGLNVALECEYSNAAYAKYIDKIARRL